MTWPLFFQLFTTAIVAFLAAWLAHRFAASRDQKNKRRDQRISFLIEAYRRLELVSNRPSLADSQPIESAIADIQLFGSPNQVRLVQDFVSQFAATGNGSLDAILAEVRKDLRAELQLERVPDKLLYLRFPQKPDNKNAQQAAPEQPLPAALFR